MRTLLGKLDRRIGLLAVLTEGDGGKRFDLQLRLLQKLGLLAGIQPEISEIGGHDTADLADLKRDGGDLRQLVFSGDLFYGINNVNNSTKFVHYFFFLLRRIFTSRLMV